MKLEKHKCCWEAKQYRKGWRLGLCIGEAKPSYIPVWFGSEKDCEKALRGTQILFVHLSERGNSPKVTFRK